MSSSVTTFGYSVPDPIQELSRLVGQVHNPLIVDIRKSTVSHYKPDWSLTKLRDRYKDRYTWMVEFGNVHFQDGEPMALFQPEKGLVKFRGILDRGYTPILLCTCEHYHACHRKIVIEKYLRPAFPELEVFHLRIGDRLTPEESMICISVQQPFCWIIMNAALLISNGIVPKIWENRSWRPNGAGFECAIRAGSIDRDFYIDGELTPFIIQAVEGLIGYDQAKKLYQIMPKDRTHYQSGGVVGTAQIARILDRGVFDPKLYPWKVRDQYGILLKDIQSVPYEYVKGDFKLFDIPKQAVYHHR